MKWGKSAAAEMHLSASGYCEQCDMMVELGTDDCPHAVDMSKTVKHSPSEQVGAWKTKFAGQFFDAFAMSREESEACLAQETAASKPINIEPST
jgi:hypothetical protein